MEIKCYLIRPLLILILVPVIAVFTKMDALDEEAHNQLLCEGVSFAKLEEQVPIRAKVLFERNYLQLLDEVKHKPHYVIQLRGMSLIDDTSNSLSHLPLRHE